MDKMDQDFSDLWTEKKEIEERCKMLEGEINQRDFNNRDHQGSGDAELQQENQYLKEQLQYMKDVIQDIESKMNNSNDLQYEAEIKSLRGENSLLKLENFKLKSEGGDRDRNEPSVIRQSSDVSDINNNDNVFNN